MPDHHTKLRELAADCCVRVGSDLADAPESGGTGVWIAPGTVLTCAHVVPAGAASLEIGWHGQILTGVVTDRAPNGVYSGLCPFPDLAIVCVANAPAHPCAWLCEAAPTRELVVFGHSAVLGEGLRLLAADGLLSGWHDYGAGRLRQFKGMEVVAGMSGGPVLDLGRGAVCGIVTTTSEEGADRGGYFVTVDGLRHLETKRRPELLLEHDRFHRQDLWWARARASLPVPSELLPNPVTAREEATLLGLMAEITQADRDRLLWLYARCSADTRPPAAALLVPRDLVYALLDAAGTPATAALSLLRMAHELTQDAPDPVRGDLYEWATAFASRHGRYGELLQIRSSQATAGTPGGVVSVEIVPGTADVEHFRLAVSVQDDQRGRRQLYQDTEPAHTLEQVKQLACEQVRAALCWLAGKPLVEFVVPAELFNEPFEALMPTHRYTDLGCVYRVVLRDYDRQQDPLVRSDWRERWRRARNTSPQTRWIACQEPLTQSQFFSELQLHPQTSLIALPQPPRSRSAAGDLLRVALDSGVPVAVWRRDGCPAHGGAPAASSGTGLSAARCTSQRFRAALDPVLTGCVTDRLPEAVRQLRNRIVAQNPTPADRACAGIVLLWDDPARASQPVAPVREPPTEPGRTARDHTDLPW